MGAFYNNASKRSGSFISGTPIAAKVYKNYADNYSDIILGAITDVTKDFEQEVKQMAKVTWGEVADHIQVRLDPTTFSISFEVASAYAQAAEDLEYGSSSESPKAVLRNAAVEANEKMPSLIEKRIMERLFS